MNCKPITKLTHLAFGGFCKINVAFIPEQWARRACQLLLFVIAFYTIINVTFARTNNGQVVIFGKVLWRGCRTLCVPAHPIMKGDKLV